MQLIFFKDNEYSRFPKMCFQKLLNYSYPLFVSFFFCDFMKGIIIF